VQFNYYIYYFLSGGGGKAFCSQMKSQVPVIGGLIDVVAQPVETVASAAGNFIVDLFNFKG